MLGGYSPSGFAFYFRGVARALLLSARSADKLIAVFRALRRRLYLSVQSEEANAESARRSRRSNEAPDHVTSSYRVKSENSRILREFAEVANA